jgi:protein pelota
MKIFKKDLKQGFVELQTETPEDLWYLSNIIDTGDLIRGKTIRKIKIGDADQRNVKIIKKPVFLKINVERSELTDNILRLSGKVTEGTDDIPAGSYHTFNVEDSTHFSITKKEWLKYQLDKLKEATEEKGSEILVCVFDREEAIFALLKKYGYEVLTEIKGDSERKVEGVQTTGNFYKDIVKLLTEYKQRYEINQIILGSPGFFKEDLMKQIIDADLKKSIILATCNNTGKSGMNEVLKRPEVREALKKDRMSQEMKIVEQLLEEISKDGQAAYGEKQVKDAANAGAIKTLIITDNFIRDRREEERSKDIEKLMKLTEKTNGDVKIITSTHDGGQKVDGLGGIAAILRYKL